MGPCPALTSFVEAARLRSGERRLSPEGTAEGRGRRPTGTWETRGTWSDRSSPFLGFDWSRGLGVTQSQSNRPVNLENSAHSLHVCPFTSGSLPSPDGTGHMTEGWTTSPGPPRHTVGSDGPLLRRGWVRVRVPSVTSHLPPLRTPGDTVQVRAGSSVGWLEGRHVSVTEGQTKPRSEEERDPESKG